MNTYVLYAISVVLIIALIYFTMTKPNTSTPVDTFPFDSINGHPNVLKNLRIYGESDSDVGFMDPIKNVGTVDRAVKVTREDSDDFILSNFVNVRNITDDSRGDENSSWLNVIFESPITGEVLFDTTKDHVFTSYVKRLSDNQNDKGVISFIPMKNYGDEFSPVNENVTIKYGSFSTINTTDLVSNEWYLMIGVLRRKGFINGKVSSGTGIHRLSNRKKVSSMQNDYILRDDSAMLGFSMDFSNDSNNEDSVKSIEKLNTKVSFTKPFIFEVDNATDSIVNGIVETMLGGKK
jgi:hypothetical protein